MIETKTIICACGSVELELIGKPIVAVACYCDDCQAGGHKLEALPGALPVVDPDGGTPGLSYRRDRMRCTKGAELLRGHKLRPKSTTTRYVASCCNTAMYVGFDNPAQFWVPVYRARFGADAPPLDMRIATRFKPPDAVLPADVPSYPGYPFALVVKLSKAGIAMLLRR